MKLMFPVIVFCPAFGENTTEMLTVELEEDEETKESEAI